MTSLAALALLVEGPNVKVWGAGISQGDLVAEIVQQIGNEMI